VARALHAPAAWRTVDFISDLHLQAAEPATFEAWRTFMARSDRDALFILGDLFEVWVGDDLAAQPGFASDCARVITDAASRGPVFLMHGNRDFLVGDAFVHGLGATLLPDPTVLDFAGARWLLTHGDALCLDDVDYQRFRAQVRSAEWQQAFLAKPLAEREAIGRQLREQSEARKREVESYADVDTAEALRWLGAAQASTLIHGHTHRPGDQALDATHRRIVLSDWDLAATPPRAEVLRLDVRGAHRIALA
jgi:UDP-2,3-diacylglucosamine hydrolase